MSEVGAKLLDAGMPEPAARYAVSILGIGEVIEVDESSAWDMVRLIPLTKMYGLSLGSRACLALAMKLGLPAVTAHNEWAKLNFCKVVVIRWLIGKTLKDVTVSTNWRKIELTINSVNCM